MIYELRIYHCVPGKLPDLLKRFDTITLKLWEKHAIHQAGFWTTLVGPSANDLTYFLKWESLAEREAKMAKFGSDPEWLAARAKTRKLKPEEYTGGSTAVSNLGMFGVKDFAAVINPPHATILAVGSGIETPVVRDGKVEIRTIMACTLSCDHRAVDGALGAKLMSVFRDLIEKPAGMVA